MHTLIGRYRWLCMPFGVRLGLMEYQRRQHEVLEGLAGVMNKADDILVRMTPTMLFPWEHSWLQSLSVKSQISPYATFESGLEGLA